jgi:hypothetical protein
MGGGVRFNSLEGSGRIVLADGKPQAFPTDDTTAVRVRALDKADALGTPGEGEILLALEVAPEPKLRWQKTLAVRVGKATDDQGQNLTQVLPAAGAPVPPPGAPVPFGGGRGGAGGFPGGLPPGPGVAVFGGTGNDHGRLTPIRLKKGAQAARSLKEISGSITAEVLSEPKALITVTDLLKSAGKTVKGTESGSLKVLAIGEQREGQFRIHCELDPPAGVALDGRSLRILPSAQGVVLANEAAPGTPYHELSVVDDKGNFLPPASLSFNANAANGTELVLTCQPGKGQGEPAKLVFSVSKSVTLDVPFTLKNVPLP